MENDADVIGHKELVKKEAEGVHGSAVKALIKNGKTEEKKAIMQWLSSPVD